MASLTRNDKCHYSRHDKNVTQLQETFNAVNCHVDKFGCIIVELGGSDYGTLETERAGGRHGNN
jgi:hypothetical protein